MISIAYSPIVEVALGTAKHSLSEFPLEGTPPIASRPYHTNPALSKRVDAVLGPHLAAGLIEHADSP